MLGVRSGTSKPPLRPELGDSHFDRGHPVPAMGFGTRRLRPWLPQMSVRRVGCARNLVPILVKVSSAALTPFPACWQTQPLASDGHLGT